MELKPDWNRNKVSLSINWLKGKSASTIIYHHLPSSTYIWGWKIWFLSKFPLNKYNDWKHRRLFRKTQDQSRSAAWGLLGSLPEKKRNDMWPCGCCMGKIYHHLIAPWMVVNILALGYEIPPKNDTYLDFCCVEILWNPPFCFLNVYIYMCVYVVYVCV